MDSAFADARIVDLILVAVHIQVGSDRIADDTLEHALDDVMYILMFQRVVALFIHDLTLLAQDIIVFQQLLAGIEVIALDPLLRLGDRLGDHLGFDLLIAQLVEQPVELFTAETHHQGIFHRYIEAGEARIALTTRFVRAADCRYARDS